MGLLNLLESREAREQRFEVERIVRVEQAKIRQKEQQSRADAKSASFSWTRLFRGDRNAASGNPYSGERKVMTRIINGK